MNNVLLITLALSASIVSGEYASYDQLKLQPLLTEQGAKAFMTCFMDETNCEGKAIVPKETVIEIMKTNCGKCSPEQKVMVEKFKKFATEKYPELFAKFVASVASSIIND